MKIFSFLLSTVFVLGIWACNGDKQTGNPENSSDLTQQDPAPNSTNDVSSEPVKVPATEKSPSLAGPISDNYLPEKAGIMVENFPPEVTDKNRFNADNKVFIPGRTFVYSYVYEARDGKQMLCETFASKQLALNKAWKFVPADQVTPKTITEVWYTVEEGLGTLGQIRKGLKRTVTRLNYVCPEGVQSFKEWNGLVENKHNVWIYPPRSKVFRVLNFNPYPYIKAPYEIGTKWDWAETIPPGYSDPRWMEITLEANLIYKYEITDKKEITTAYGKFDCFEVTASANFRMGDTYLTAYFNEDYGFVQMNYTNIDGSKIKLELKDVKMP